MPNYFDSEPQTGTGLTAPGFHITDGKGFHIQFENGWTVSVQFGGGNYGENYNFPIGEQRTKRLPPSSRAEIAAWDRNKRCHEFSHGTVEGWQTPAQVLAFMNMIAALPNGE